MPSLHGCRLKKQTSWIRKNTEINTNSEINTHSGGCGNMSICHDSSSPKSPWVAVPAQAASGPGKGTQAWESESVTVEMGPPLLLSRRGHYIYIYHSGGQATIISLLFLYFKAFTVQNILDEINKSSQFLCSQDVKKHQRPMENHLPTSSSWNNNEGKKRWKIIFRYPF